MCSAVCCSSPSAFLSLPGRPPPARGHSRHCPGAEDRDPGRGREQPHRPAGVVQLLLPWQLLSERGLRDQAALDGCDRRRAL